MLLLAIQQPEFIVSACVLNDNLSQLLQSVQIDLLGAMAYVNDVTASGSNRALWPVCRTLNLCSLVSPAAAGSATELTTCSVT